MTALEMEPFLQYISPECNRKAFIQNFMKENGIECAVLALDGKEHLYVKFPASQYDSMFKIKTVIAHYDRVAGSPGANDNSAADFCIMNWAVRLSKMQIPHNVRIIFTDGEECGQNGIQEQGAYALAQNYKKLGITDDEIYVFDSIGRGTVPVICQYDLPSGIDKRFLSRLKALENKAEKIIRKASGGLWFKLKSNYSDNASFLVNGIPAVAVTMLPSEEIEDYIKSGKTPLTWKLFHTPEDNFTSLESRSLDLFNLILDYLAVEKTICTL